MEEKGESVRVIGIDTNSQVTKMQNEKTPPSLSHSLSFSCEDIRSLSLPDESIDVALDKGTFDSILCMQGKEAALDALGELERVVKMSGRILLISHAASPHRLSLFNPRKFNVSVRRVPFSYRTLITREISRVYGRSLSLSSLSKRERENIFQRVGERLYRGGVSDELYAYMYVLKRKSLSSPPPPPFHG